MAAGDSKELHQIEERLLGLHERIRERVLAAQRRSALGSGGEATDSEARVAGEGAADLNFGIDLAAEAEIEAFAEEFARTCPIRVLSEGLGDRVYGVRGREPLWRIVIDPIDGTRNLMFDVRSGWVLTACAPERGAATRLSDVRVAVQSELPPTDRRSAAVLTAIRGEGARARRVDLDTGAYRDDVPLAASRDDRVDNGFFVFFKFNREERSAITAIEQRFLDLLVAERGAESRLLFDDQYISSAGQMYLLLTRRYRFLADLRGIVGDRLGIANQTSKPYDVCCALIASEAGIPLTDAMGAPFDVPLDLESRVSLVGYANDRIRASLEPLLARAIAEALPPGGGASR